MTPQPTPVGTLAVHRVRLGDARPAIAVTWDGTISTATGLLCDRGALRAALTGVDVAVAVLSPMGTSLLGLLAAADGCGAATPLLATRRPVTDAVKRVHGRALVDTLDRSVLAWAAPPAAVHLPTLLRWLDAAEEDLVRPLSGGWAPIAWL